MAQAENDAQRKTVFRILTRQLQVTFGFQIFKYVTHKSSDVEYDVTYCLFL